MGPAVLPWGFHTWHAIHYIALGYPTSPSQEDVSAYSSFFLGLGHVLPCKFCTHHYIEHLKTLPPDLSSRDALFAWTVALHNVVNKSLGKREWRDDEARKYYLSLAGTSGGVMTKENTTPHDNNNKIIGAIVLLGVVAAVVVVVWKKNILFKKIKIQK